VFLKRNHTIDEKKNPKNLDRVTLEWWR